MQLNEKIRTVRESKSWSQEEMAEKLNMSTNGYARIERGETKPTIQKLEKIADTFGMDLVDLLSVSGKGIFYVFGDNTGSNNNNHYSSSQELVAENEKLKQAILHKDELLAYKDEFLAQKQRENDVLQELVDALKAK